MAALNPNMTSTFTLSNTNVPTGGLTVPLNVAIPTGTPIQYLYKRLYQVAFADAVHDEVIQSQQKPSSATHNLQCNFFNRAMPQIPASTLPPGCKTPASAFGGLNIDAGFKTKHGCEEEAWKSVVYKGTDYTPTNYSIIAQGTSASFTQDVPNIKAIFSTMSPCDKPINNPVTSSGRYAIKTVNNKVYDVRKIRWNAKKTNDATVSGANLAHYLGLFDHVPTNSANKQKAFILLDAENAGILDQFKTGAINDFGFIYYLMLPEYMADSATKKRWKATNELCCGKKQKPDAGVRIKFAGKIKSEYPAWSEDNRNTFFSRFSCSMEVTDFTTQTVRQDWYSSDTPTGTTNLVQTILNSCKENNQPTIQTYLKGLPSVTPGTSNKANLQQLALQRKRSGDQMQALAIKRLGLNPTTPPTTPPTPSGSEYLHVSTDKGGDEPTSGSTGTLFNNIRRHAWLITHDLTLCSYALFLGINVLHTNKTGTTKDGSLAKTITSFRLISPPGDDNFN